jgi:hypothetical protein
MPADNFEPKVPEERIAKHGREFDVMTRFPQFAALGLSCSQRSRVATTTTASSSMRLGTS